MNLPFCDQCPITKTCQQDLSLFKAATGNKRIPPESFCRAQYERAGVDIGDFYRNVMVNAVEDPTSLYPVFPELKKQIEQLEQEWRSQRAEEHKHCDTCCDKSSTPEELVLTRKMPMSVTLMLTERCNLACEYCYERFSGNNQPKTMSRAVIYQSIQRYLNREILALYPYNQWDLIGGEVFVEFDLLKYTVNTILARYKELGEKYHSHFAPTEHIFIVRKSENGCCGSRNVLDHLRLDCHWTVLRNATICVETTAMTG